MARRALIYTLVIAGLAFLLVLAATVSTLTSAAVQEPEWLAFCLLLGAGVANRVSASNRYERPSYPLAPVFNVAGALVLHPALFAAVAVLPHAAGWIKGRRGGERSPAGSLQAALYASCSVVAGLAARLVYSAVAPASVLHSQAVAAGCVAAATYVLMADLLTFPGLARARGTADLFAAADLERVAVDLLLGLTGYTLAALWGIQPWLALPTLASLFLLQRALEVPRLRLEARTDEKTGLWNARHFTALGEEMLAQARQANQPLTLLMADLDLLRNINNRYGHLAGDAVLAEIGIVLREISAPEDLAARFGGEEFCVVRLGAGQLDGHALGEALRVAVADRRFRVPGRSEPIIATMSVGVACYPQNACTLHGLLEAADMAVYRAKRQGRNCVVDATPSPRN